jgi:hypothetical protein
LLSADDHEEQPAALSRTGFLRSADDVPELLMVAAPARLGLHVAPNAQGFSFPGRRQK